MTPLALAVVAARGVNLAATLLAFGAAVVAAAMAPQRAHRPRLLIVAVGMAGLSGAAWLVVQSADMADAATIGDAIGAVPAVLFGTRFGHTLALRLMLLLAAGFASGGPRWRGGAAMLLAGCAAAAQAWLGHAAASAEIVLPASVMAHVLAAGAWLGGLLPLWLLVGEAPLPAATVAARRFSTLGLAAVAVLAGTAFLQGRELIGGIPGLFGTTYGRLALTKLTLFGLLIGFAAVNRTVLVPRMAAGSEHARGRLRISIGIETALGLAVVLTAATMAEQFPASHEQPEWPFPWRLDPGLLADPATRRALVPAAVGLGLALLAGVAAALVRRVRWWGLAGAAALAAAAALGLGPLLVPAYPTTYYSSLTDFSASSIAHGALLFARNCTGCHGPDGRGDGPAAASLPVPPVDLTAPHLWAHPDGDLYWWITHGYAAPSGEGLAMPGFAGTISDDGRWNLVDYLHAHAAGAEVAALGQWPVAVPAPEMDVTCPWGDVGLSDLRGRVVRIVASDGAVAAAPGLLTVVLTRAPLKPGGEVCVAHDPEAPAAYAIIAGLSPAELSGAWFLVDPQGWVRRLWPVGEGTAVPTAAELDAAAREVVREPVRQAIPGHHH